MTNLKDLELELEMIDKNINFLKEKIKQYKDDNIKYPPYNCSVVGELKHRLIAFKKTITRFNSNPSEKFYE